MRKMVWIRFSEHADKAAELLRPLGFNADEKTWIQEVSVPFADDRRGLLTHGLKLMGISYTEIEYQEFDETELEAADYLHMTAEAMWGYPQPEDDYEKLVFDPSTSCPKCGQGAKQVKPFMVKGKPGFDKNDIVAMFWTYELLVTEKLRRLIEDAELTGIEFWPLLKYRGGATSEEIKGAYQLYFTNELPPMSENTRFEIVPLPRGTQPCSCGKLGRNLRGEQMRYRRKDLKGAKDFNKTSEWLGGGFGTTQWKVVSHRVYELFTKNKIRGVRFEPVLIED